MEDDLSDSLDAIIARAARAGRTLRAGARTEGLSPSLPEISLENVSRQARTDAAAAARRAYDKVGCPAPPKPLVRSVESAEPQELQSAPFNGSPSDGRLDRPRRRAVVGGAVASAMLGLALLVGWNLESSSGGVSGRGDGSSDGRASVPMQPEGAATALTTPGLRAPIPAVASTGAKGAVIRAPFDQSADRGPRHQELGVAFDRRAADPTAVPVEPRVGTARDDALQSARTVPADSGNSPILMVVPVAVEPVYVLVRADSRLRYLHELKGLRINTGGPLTGRALTVEALYQNLFGQAVPVHALRWLDEVPALQRLVRGELDAVVLVGSASKERLMSVSDARGPPLLKMLSLDSGHESSHQSRVKFFPVQVGAAALGQIPVSGASTLGFMSSRIAPTPETNAAPPSPKAPNFSPAAAAG